MSNAPFGPTSKKTETKHGKVTIDHREHGSPLRTVKMVELRKQAIEIVKSLEGTGIQVYFYFESPKTHENFTGCSMDLEMLENAALSAAFYHQRIMDETTPKGSA